MKNISTNPAVFPIITAVSFTFFYDGREHGMGVGFIDGSALEVWSGGDYKMHQNMEALSGTPLYPEHPIKDLQKPFSAMSLVDVKEIHEALLEF